MQDLGEVVADRLAFPVRVSGQIDRLGLLRCSAQLVDQRFLAFNHRVGGLEAVLDIDGQFFFGQILHVPQRSLDHIVLPQVLVDGSRLCRRLDNDERLLLRCVCHNLLLNPPITL